MVILHEVGVQNYNPKYMQIGGSYIFNNLRVERSTAIVGKV